jgi:splicing factor 3A subunit 3
MSALEQIRSSHEELEVYHQVLLHELSRHPRSKRQIVFQDHKLSHVGQSAHKRARLLVNLHEDKHNLLANECKELQNQQERFPQFYRELQDISKFHATNGGLLNQNQTLPTGSEQQDQSSNLAVDLFSDLGIPESGSSLVNFSGEEYFGRYLDLHTFFLKYKNLPGSMPKASYETYVGKLFYNFTNFPATTKIQRRYNNYINELLEYVLGFLQRIRPLANHNSWKEEQVIAFDDQWSKGKVNGWENCKPNPNVIDKEKVNEGEDVDLKQYGNAMEMEKLGLDVLKAQLSRLGVKCGGTLTDRAERLYTVITRYNGQDIPKELRAKKKRNKRPRGGGKDVHSSSSSSNTTTTDRNLAQMEWLIHKAVTTMLKVEVSETLRHLERKKTRTKDEMNREMKDELKRDDEEGADGKQKDDGVDVDDSDDEQEMLYNPKGLPLGWDGKPIPFWLYRLHGLSKSYKCEICGNHTYWGHKEFDEHFQEIRHQHGMKCLKIPNTNHFHGITSISDALSLYTKLKNDLQKNVFNKGDQEEFEDSAGNVMNKASYEDLKKQGLL